MGALPVHAESNFLTAKNSPEWDNSPSLSLKNIADAISTAGQTEHPLRTIWSGESFTDGAGLTKRRESVAEATAYVFQAADCVVTDRKRQLPLLVRRIACHE